MEIHAGEFAQESSELQKRCHRWSVDDPLANHLRGYPFLGLRRNAFLSSETKSLFESLRTSRVSDSQQLYSFFRLEGSLKPQIWKDSHPVIGKTFMEGRKIRYGVRRYHGPPLDGKARRVMDVFNHTRGWPDSISAEELALFLQDKDINVQAIVGGRGTQIIAKPKHYDALNFNILDFFRNYREFRDKNLGNPEKYDKEFSLWAAKHFNLKMYWVKAGERFLQTFK